MDTTRCQGFRAREAEYSIELPDSQALSGILVALDLLTTRYRLNSAAPRQISIIIFDFLMHQINTYHYHLPNTSLKSPIVLNSLSSKVALNLSVSCLKRSLN